MASNATVTPRMAAQKLQIRLDAVYSLIWSCKLPAEKRDGRWLVDERAVDLRAKAKLARLGEKASTSHLIAP